MKGLYRQSCFAVLAALALLGAPGAAMAACTSPAGEESKTIWDFTAHVMKMCDGTNWLSMAGGSSSGTAGYVQFSGGSGGFSSDSTAGGQLYWDSTNHRLGIGTATPTTPLSVATAQGTSGGILVLDSTDANNPRVQLRTSNPNGNGVVEVLDNTEAVKIQLHGNGPSYINSGNVGIGTTTPSYLLSLGGGAAHTIGMERTSTGTNGYGLTLLAGGAKSATSNLNGGDLTLSSGTATGTGTAAIVFMTTTAGSSGTSDNTPTVKMKLTATGNLVLGTGDNSATTSSGTIRGANGGGTNIAGGNLTIQGGLATGSAATGDIIFQGAPVGSSGATAQTSATYMTIKGGGASAGNVGIGTTSPTEALTVNGNVLATTYLYSSDRRLKADIAPLLGQLAKVNALEPVSFTMKADPDHAERLGLIAQDVEPLYPELVHTNSEGMKAIDYAALVAPLIAAVKELKAANDTLAARVEILEAQASPMAGPRPTPANARPARTQTLNR